MLANIVDWSDNGTRFDFPTGELRGLSPLKRDYHLMHIASEASPKCCDQKLIWSPRSNRRT